MNNNIICIGTLFLIIGIGAVYVLFGSSLSLTPPTGMYTMSDSSMMGQNIDQHFIAQMISHHEGAIAMAKTALERSKRPELIAFAKGIIDAQEIEIVNMKDWYQSWFGTVAPTMGGMGMHLGGMNREPEVLTSVTAIGFDREFIKEMIPHHEMAIMMAQMLAAGTNRAEMKQLAENIITSQSSEIEIMRGWLESW